MNKRLAVLHTVAFLVDRFKATLRERLPQVDSFHMLDESLLQDLLRHGPTPSITRRVVTFATLAADAGADLILFTCSSTSPAIDVARRIIATPILKIDDPLADRAVTLGRRIGSCVRHQARSSRAPRWFESTPGVSSGRSRLRAGWSMGPLRPSRVAIARGMTGWCAKPQRSLPGEMTW